MGHGAPPKGPALTSEPVADAFRRGGFILTGRTNTPEFGSITVTENDRFGATRNPWSPAHTPGGSSGGAGAAVASGMFPVAHASDGGGSIRIPASCCGLVGLKPSRGRVASTVPGWQGLSTEGALSRTVADSAAVLDLISGPDPHAWWNAPVPDRPFLDEVGADPGRLRVALCSVSALGLPVAAGAGRRPRPCRPPARGGRPSCRPARCRRVRRRRSGALPPRGERRPRARRRASTGTGSSRTTGPAWPRPRRWTA